MNTTPAANMRIMLTRTSLLLWSLIALFLAVTPFLEAQAVNGKGTIKIRLVLNDRVLTATLHDNATSRDLVSMLPMKLTLEDYARTEKISYLPGKLSTVGAPSGSDPSVGDITYYAPWGNLAIFYKDFSYASGLVPLGKIEGDIAPLAVPGSVMVTIEQAKE